MISDKNSTNDHNIKNFSFRMSYDSIKMSFITTQISISTSLSTIFTNMFSTPVILVATSSCNLSTIPTIVDDPYNFFHDYNFPELEWLKMIAKSTNLQIKIRKYLLMGPKPP